MASLEEAGSCLGVWQKVGDVMKKNLAMVFGLLLVSAVMVRGAGAYVTISTPSGVVKMGSFPSFSFRVKGYGTNLMVQPILMKGGEPVGSVTYGSRSSSIVSSNEVTGEFTWGLTRVIGMMNPNRYVKYPPAGRYTVLFGVYRTPAELQTSATNFSRAKFAAFAESSEFELVGTPPPLIITRGNGPRVVTLYASGVPGERYVLLWRSSLDSYIHEYEIVTLVIPEEGVWAGDMDVSKSNIGFFRLLLESPE